MEYRKLIKFGNSSHVISLPKTWLDKQGIKKGDIIYFEENENGDIIISSKEYKDTDEGKNLKIDIDGLTNKEIQLEIVSGYIKEFRKIILTGKEIKTKATEIRKILHELIGIEIIEQTKSKIIAKDFLNICEIRLEDLRKRLNMPHKLSEVIKEEDFQLDRLSKMALEDPSTGGNPKKLTEADMKTMYQHSMSGTLF